MVKLPSFDSRIDKAKGEAEGVHTLSTQLAAALCNVPAASDQAAYEAETAQLAQLRAMTRRFEADIRTFVHDIATRTDRAYAAFDAVDEVSGYQAFIAFFRRRQAPSFKVIRTRKLAIAESLRLVLLEAAAIHDLVHSEKELISPLVLSCEQQIASSMEKRRGVVSAMDDARQRDRELAALIGTLRRKIKDASDEDRLQAFVADDKDAETRRDAVLLERKQLTDAHQILDRQAVLLADMIDLLNDQLVLFTLSINKISIEAERCIQLYDAVYGTLEPLMANTRPHSSRADDGDETTPLGAFRTLLMLHAQGNVTMQDIEKRKVRADHALSLRYADGTKPAAG